MKLLIFSWEISVLWIRTGIGFKADPDPGHKKLNFHIKTIFKLIIGQKKRPTNSDVEPQLFITVPAPVLTFEKLWFRFRFQLLKSYGSGSGSYF